MVSESFNKLIKFVREDLVANQQMAHLRGGLIILEVCLLCTIQWLAGASYLDILVNITGTLVPSFSRIVCKTLKAISDSPELQMKLSETSSWTSGAKFY